jgi:nitroreductase
MNGQPCSFIVIRDQDIKGRLADIKDAYCAPEKQHYKATMLRCAPVVVVICVDRHTAHERVLENGCLAAAQLMLAAHGRGIGSVFMTAYRADEPQVTAHIRDLLNIPASVEPVVILPLGYPDELPTQKKLRSLEDIVFHERYNQF